jgi:hypothetical protein
MISSDRFPTSGYGKGRLNDFGKDWHLAGQGIPGSENVPGVAAVIRTGPTGQGSTYVMTQKSDNQLGDHREVMGELPEYPWRFSA